MTGLGFPYRIDQRGRTAENHGDAYIRDLIEQVLFTSPGERINRPSFGSGLHKLVFAPNSDELATAIQALTQGAVEQWLGDLIQIIAVDVAAEEHQLSITIKYLIRRDGRPQTDTFIRPTDL